MIRLPRKTKKRFYKWVIGLKSINISHSKGITNKKIIQDLYIYYKSPYHNRIEYVHI